MHTTAIATQLLNNASELTIHMRTNWAQIQRECVSVYTTTTKQQRELVKEAGGGKERKKEKALEDW